VSGLNIDARRSPSISNSNSYSWPRRRTSNVARSEPALGYYAPAGAGGAMLTVRLSPSDLVNLLTS
jgi:hypothetical protein